MRLENQIAIITGGGQGIGQQIAFRLGQEGAVAVIADINEKGSWETAEMMASSGGKKARVIPTDITSEEQVVNLIQGTLEIDKRIDILVNNSGIMGPVKNIEDIPLEEWEATMAVNLRGMFLCVKHTVPTMKRQGKGSIVNIASITGKRPLIQRTPYAASKMGVIGLTRTLAAELGRWKIRVNAVCPGAVIGPRLDLVIEGIMKYSGKSRDQVVAERTEASALKSFVDAQYIAAVVAFLCSEDAVMMTGQDINVCAGTIMY
ncbi:MAG: SDR family oxidoreductase [Deltaproteobacteria bacterium]|nr:SDR family oxidoreductase [Deltaproteobacteria bacterium]